MFTDIVCATCSMPSMSLWCWSTNCLSKRHRCQSCCMHRPLGADSRQQMTVNKSTRFYEGASNVVSADKTCWHSRNCWRTVMNNYLTWSFTIHNTFSIVYYLSSITTYQLRQRTHNLQSPQHTGRVTDSNFLTRMLYRDSYLLYKVLFTFSTICVLTSC